MLSAVEGSSRPPFTASLIVVSRGLLLEGIGANCSDIFATCKEMRGLSQHAAGFRLLVILGI